ncbi:membrane protein insertase YidC [Desmospora profundinema]|uniref:Membrane protein insertase YidC n=1 Tax=Desmospora profundinema TaxID=1571184 RepID=A0ABU1IKU5_9BACL|nr:membrane protein insertase YidC [Desmospora profundinema]MDR6225368.1 YidC/Oxa1 family membrane protein insertase [Desmospora profundinema]
MFSRRLIGILVLVTALLLLAGCVPDMDQYKPIDPETAGFWDLYFVRPLQVLLEESANILGSYGLAILVVTVLVRLIVLPLTLKQMKSSQAMQALQPEMVKLREKYKNNQQKLQEETMKLFQKHNVNPLAGCLPLLVQLPILIAFFQAIIRDEAIKNASFLWMELGQADPTFVLPVLAAVTTYLQSVVMGMGDNPQARAFMFIMPIMIFALAFTFPAALALYWVYSNLFTMLQYMLLGNKYKVKREGATG